MHHLVLWATACFGRTTGGSSAAFDWLGVRDVGQNRAYSATVPHQAFIAFPAHVRHHHPALITGAFAERAKFSTFLVFIVVWSNAGRLACRHWVGANDGWLRELGAMTSPAAQSCTSTPAWRPWPQHLSSAAYRLRREPMDPTTSRMLSSARALLWFDWFGFTPQCHRCGRPSDQCLRRNQTQRLPRLP